MTPDRLSLILRELRDNEESKLNRLFGPPRHEPHHHIPGRVTIPVSPPNPPTRRGYVQTALERFWRLLVRLRPVLFKIASYLWPFVGVVTDLRTGLVTQNPRFPNTNASRLLREAL